LQNIKQNEIKEEDESQKDNNSQLQTRLVFKNVDASAGQESEDKRHLDSE
jgi:hypothetical protein